MKYERIETGKAPLIRIGEVTGDLRVQGWNDTAVILKGEDYILEPSEKGLTVNCHDTLRLVVPAGSSFIIDRVHGDLNVKHVEGDVNVDEVNGDASISGAGRVEAGTVHGDLSARHLNSDLTVQEVMGDASLRHTAGLQLGVVHGDLSARYVQGNFSLVEVMGDVSLATVNGDAVVERGHRDANLRNLGGRNNFPAIMGDVRLYGSLAAGKHTFNADGDIVIRWPADAPLNLTATASQVLSRIPLTDEQRDGDTLTARLGEGETTLLLEAKGRIILKEAEPHERGGYWGNVGPGDMDVDMDLGDLGEMIAAKIDKHTSELTAHLEHKFGPDFMQKMSERTAERAEKAAERAMRQAERAMRHARRYGDSGFWSAPAAAKKESKVSAEEQLKILQMLEKGTISVEEADVLLNALE